MIHWFAEGMTPYWNAYFRELAREPGIKLQVHYRIGIPESHPWKFGNRPGYDYRNFIGPRIIPDLLSIRSVLTGRETLFVFAGTKGITKTILLLLVTILNRRFIYLGDTFPDDYLKGIKGILVRRFLLSLVFKYARRVLSTGSAGVDRLREFGCSEGKTVNFPYFIEIPPREKIRSSGKIIPPRWKEYIYPEDFVFLASGFMIGRKGFDTILKAFHLSLKKTDKRNIKLIIAGDGPDRKKLENIVDKCGINKEVYFSGWIQPGEIDEFYGLGDVFIHMASFEPYGVVVLEAMARKLPVIGSDGTMAVLDRVRHGENGFIVESNNIEKLAATIDYCWNNRNKMLAMGMEARKTAEEWPISRGVKIVKNLYVEAN